LPPWDALLSRQAEVVQQAYLSLAPVDRQAVLAHMQRMSVEPGWHPEQRISAEFALQAISAIQSTFVNE